jgi:hypothetical protein
MDMPESTPLEDAVEVFPRLKERDPYKCVIATEAAEAEAAAHAAAERAPCGLL